MGFRNPITTAADPTARAAAAAAQTTANNANTAAASAQTAANNAITLADNPLGQIPDGTLPGSKLAADAIDGRTITGSTLRTAAAGQRVQIDSTNGLVGYNATGQAVTQVRTSDGTLIATGAQITGTLDTGASATTTGVKVYQGSKGGIPSGTVEWRTGQMDTNPTVQLTGGGSGGALFVVSGGGSTGVSSPSLGLNVEGLPAGGYGPVLRLNSGAAGTVPGHITPDTWLDPPVAVSPFPGAANVIAYSASANVWQLPRFAKLASGRVVLSGLLGYTGASLAAGTVLGTLPAGCRPTRTLMFAQPGGNNRMWRAQVNPSGQVIFQAALSSDWSFVVGDNQGFLSLDGISFLASDLL